MNLGRENSNGEICLSKIIIKQSCVPANEYTCSQTHVLLLFDTIDIKTKHKEKKSQTCSSDDLEEEVT